MQVQKLHVWAGIFEDPADHFRIDYLRGYVGFRETWAAHPLSRKGQVATDGSGGELVWEEKTWIGHVNFFSAFDQERSHVASVRTADLVHFSDFLFLFDGQSEGYIGMRSPAIVQVGDDYTLTYNSWGDKPGSPNQLFYMQSADLVHWSERRPLAPKLAQGVRAIDAALAFVDEVWHLIFEREQSQRPVIATAPSLGDPWRLVGAGGACFFSADGCASALSHENFQFVEVDGCWRLLSTDYASRSGVTHHPYLYTISGTGGHPEDWLHWENGYRLGIPAESFNTISRDNAAALCDWREHVGHF